MIEKTGTDIISKIISPALRLWLKSQVEEIETLELKITVDDGQILKGYIPQVYLATNRAIYQGLHLREIELKAENIKINLGQIIRGKALRLLEPVPVFGQLLLNATDLQASLISPLLSSGLTDLLCSLLEKSGIQEAYSLLRLYQISWQNITIDQEKFTINGTFKKSDHYTYFINIRSGLSLSSPQKLNLNPIYIEGLPEDLTIDRNQIEIDLGDLVEISQLSLGKGELSCIGQLIVKS